MSRMVRAAYDSAPTSPISRLIATCGGNATASSSNGVCLAYDAQYNASRIAGVLQHLDDARGPTGFGGRLNVNVIGAPVTPGIGYDETKQVITFTAANQSLLEGPLDGLANLGAVGAGDQWWMAFIGTINTVAPAVYLQNASGLSLFGIAAVSAGSFLSTYSTGSQALYATSAVTVSATRRCMISTLVYNTSHQIEVRAQSPVSVNTGEIAYANEPFHVDIGGNHQSTFFDGDMRTLLIGKGALTSAQRTAINTYATTTDGTHNNASTNA